MKSKRAEFFDDAVVSGPDQKAFEEKIYAEAQAKRWPRVAEGTGKFEGQVVIVTGAAGGQGEMEAKMIAQQGAKVYMADIEEEGLKRVEAAIIADGGEAVAFPMDVADEDAWRALVKKVVDESGRLDVLVNNAGITKDGFLVRMKDDDFDRVITINLRGAFICTREAAKIMTKARHGRIVNISSVVGQMGNAGQANYSAAKAGLLGLTKSCAKELAARQITVNAVAPGFIETDMTAALPEAVRAEMAKGIPAGRAGKPEDVANAVAFFAAEQSSYLTGQVLCADGGMAM